MTQEFLDIFAKNNGFVGWFRTSAKDDINIDESFQLLVNSILQANIDINQENGEAEINIDNFRGN